MLMPQEPKPVVRMMAMVAVLFSSARKARYRPKHMRQTRPILKKVAL